MIQIQIILVQPPSSRPGQGCTYLPFDVECDHRLALLTLSSMAFVSLEWLLYKPVDDSPSDLFFSMVMVGTHLEP